MQYKKKSTLKAKVCITTTKTNVAQGLAAAEEEISSPTMKMARTPSSRSGKEVVVSAAAGAIIAVAREAVESSEVVSVELEPATAVVVAE